MIVADKIKEYLGQYEDLFNETMKQTYLNGPEEALEAAAKRGGES